MCDSKKTKGALIEELRLLRSRVEELERAEAEHGRAEQVLRENGRRYAKAEQIGHFGHWERDFVTNQATWSQECYRICGVEPEQFEPTYENYLNVIHPSDRPLFESAVQAALSQGSPFDIEYRIVRPDGTERIVHSVAVIHLDKSGRPAKLVGTAHDITERKQTEGALRQAQEQLETRVRQRTAELSRANAFLKEQISKRRDAEEAARLKTAAIESCNNAVTFVDLQGNVVYVNNSFLKLWAYTEENQVLGKPAVQFWADTEAGREITRLVRDRGSWVGELKALRRDGSTFDVELSASLIVGEGGKPICIMGSFIDITERRLAEKALRKSEEKYRLVIENTRDIAYSITPEGTITFIGPQVANFGYSVDDIVGHNLRDFIHPDDLQRVMRDLARTLATGETPATEFRLLRKDGSYVFAEETGSAVYEGDRIVLVTGSIRDMTERRRAEEALRESEHRYKALFEGAAEGIVVADVETKKFLYVNSAVCRMLGYTEEEFGRMGVRDIHPSQDLEHVLSEFEAQARGEKTLAPNVPCLRSDGTMVYADVNTARVVIDGKKCNVGFFTDITDRKRAEDRLQDSEEKYRRIVESLRQEYFFYSHGPDGIFSYVSPSISNVLGYSQQEFLKHYTEYLTDNPVNREVIRRSELAIQGEQQPPYEVETYHKDGSIHRLEVTEVPVFDAEGNVIVVEGIAHDITQHRKAQEALRDSEQQYRTLTHNIPGMVYTGNFDWSTSVISNSEAVCGYSVEDFNAKKIKWLDVVHQDDREKVVSEALKLANGRASIVQEYRIIDRTGRIRWIEDRKTSQFDSGGAFRGVDGIVLDITERKRAEEELQRAREELEIRVVQRTADLAKAIEDLKKEIEERKRADKALREAEERFRTIFENTVIGLYRTTPDGRILMANPALINMLGYSSFDELAERNLEREGFDSPRSRSGFRQRLKKRGHIIGQESVWIKRDGTRLFVCESAVAIRDDNANILYYEGTVEDITERKKAEEQLLIYQDQLRSLASELSLAEERLRRKIATDVHDHVGQNLAISKIKLESLRQAVSSPQLAESLDEIRQLVGQTIESTRSLTFELSPPVLYELGFEAAVEWLVRQTRQRDKLSTDFKDDGRSKPLNNNVRVLLFQAVRELLVNVVKHAQAREVKVSTRRVGDEIQISVEDDGVGFDTSQVSLRSYKTAGFGLFSIRERLGHIGGSLSVDSKPGRGTRITLAAPVNSDKKSNRGEHK